MGIQFSCPHSEEANSRCWCSVLELLPCALHHAAGDLHTAKSTDVLSDPARERYGDALAILGGFEPARVAWIADKRNLGQDRRHVGTDQNDEGRLLNAPVADAWTLER